MLDAGLSVSARRSFKFSLLNELGVRFVAGDSGDTAGEGSVIDAESTVEAVVVGDESAELSEFDVEALPCGLWKGEKLACSGLFRAESCSEGESLSGCDAGACPRYSDDCCVSASAPNTDANDGSC